MRSKRYRSIVIVALVTIAVLAVTVFTCVRYASKAMTRYSYSVLTASTRRLAREYYETIRTDQTILQAMAELLAEQEPGDTEAALRIMTSFDLEKTFIDALELMTPDDRMLDQNGEWFEITNGTAFEAEAAKGAYVSDRVSSFRNPGELIVCDAVPVVRDGETAAILYGVIPLQDKSRTIDPELYDGSAVMMLVDGATGDILLDTWHDTLGNLDALRGRKMLEGYSYEQAVENMRAGVGGDMRLVSNSTGKVMYMHYEPVGINNWSLVVGVSEDEALAGTRASVQALYWMVVIVGVTLVGCMIFIACCLISDRRRVYRMSVTDQGTGLLNRRAYEKYLHEHAQREFSFAACVYLDANGLHEINNRHGHDAGDQMLRTVADCLRAQFPYSRIFRIGGDEFVAFPAEDGHERCEARMRKVADAIAAQGYTVSCGLACRRDVTGLDELVREADEKMLENKRAYYAEHDRRKPR